MSKKKKHELYDRVRHHCLLLYPDCEGHKEALDKISDMASDGLLKYIGIEHDKDIDEEASTDSEEILKKAHYHLVVSFPEARTRSAFAKQLGIEERHIEPAQDKDSAKRYLLHIDDENKHQYEIAECFGNDIESLQRLIAYDGKDCNDILPMISAFIDSQLHFVNTQSVLNFCCKNRVMGYYRSCALIIHRLIDEHNVKYQQKNENS